MYTGHSHGTRPSHNSYTPSRIYKATVSTVVPLADKSNMSRISKISLTAHVNIWVSLVSQSFTCETV